MRIRAVILILLVASAGLSALGSAVGESEQNLFIQPGTGYRILSAYRVFHESPCTVGYILRDTATDRLWAATAGHCDVATGRVAHAVYGEWGRFVWSNHERADGSNDIVSDIGLIEIYDQYQDNVDPAIAGWGGPTGVAPSDLQSPGDLTGHTSTPLPGNDVTSSGELRRTGTSLGSTSTTWMCQCVVQGGDSGGPFIDVSTGLALGVLSGKLYEPDGSISTEKVGGAHFGGELARIHAAGWSDLVLVTTAYVAPP